MIIDYSFETDLGYNRSDFHWSIGEDEGVSVVSELEWKGLKGPYGLLHLEAEFDFSLYLFIEGEGALFTGGRVVDSDYIETSKAAMTYRSISRASGSVFLAYRACLGCPIFFYDRALRLDLTLGLRVNRERLRMTEGNIIGGTEFEPGPLRGCRNRYVTLWRGPEASLNLTYREGPFACAALFNFFFPTYYAKGHWNLRDDLPEPFIHQGSKGFGSKLGGSLTYFFSSFSLGFTAAFSHLSTDHGTDKSVWIDPFGQKAVCMGRLNEVVITSRIYTLNFDFLF